MDTLRQIKGLVRLLWKASVRLRYGAPAVIPTSLVTEDFGYSRGTPIDRKFIENYIEHRAGYIRGVVLEIGEPYYTNLFGRSVSQVDILHRYDGNATATIVGDLQIVSTLQAKKYDCIILTQVLNFLADPRAALKTAWHSLKPGGSMLLSVACLSPISAYDRDRWGDYWRITTQGLDSLIRELEPLDYEIHAYGSIDLAIAFLRGCAYEDLSDNERTTEGGDRFPVVVCAFVRKIG